MLEQVVARYQAYYVMIVEMISDSTYYDRGDCLEWDRKGCLLFTFADNVEKGKCIVRREEFSEM